MFVKSTRVMVIATRLPEGAFGPVEHVIERRKHLQKPDFVSRTSQAKTATHSSGGFKQTRPNGIPKNLRKVAKGNSGLCSNFLCKDRALAILGSDIHESTQRILGRHRQHKINLDL